MSSANLPAPYLGVNQKVPLAALQSPYCENLLNFNTDEAGISLRNGDGKYSRITGPYAIRAIAPWGTLRVIGIGQQSTGEIVIFNATTGAVISTSGVVAGSPGFTPVYFNGRLFFFTSSAAIAPGYYYDGTTTGTIGYTGTSFTNPRAGTPHKNRLYIMADGEAKYWYSEISAVTGTVTLVDLSSVVTEKTELSCIAQVTLADNVSSVELLVFVMLSGEVLFYSGSYPDSSDWSLVGRARVGIPFTDSFGGNGNAGVQFGGDYLLFTHTGVFSLRDLFLKGSQGAALLTMNSNVYKTWQALAAELGSFGRYVRGVWDRENGRIIIGFPRYFDSDGADQNGAFFFVFDAEREAWSFHRSLGLESNQQLADMCYFSKQVLFTARVFNGTEQAVMIWNKESTTGFTDRNYDDDAEVEYEYDMLSAPIPFPKTAVYEATLIEPILESDLYAQTNWNFVVDFGRQTSGDQTTDAATDSVAKPAVNVGMQNITFVQVKMSGETAASKTVGLTLYSYNVLYNAGAEGSR